MSIKNIRDRKSRVRKQILSDIHELNSELSGLKEILRLKQCMLRQINQEMYRMSRASSYLHVVLGGQHRIRIPIVSEKTPETESVQPTKLRLIQGWKV